MPALDLNAADFMFKLLYKSGLDKDVLLRNNALLLWASHETDFTTATGIRIPVKHSMPQGVGDTNANAATASTSSQGTAFLVPQRHITQYAQIDGDVVRNAKHGGDASQLVDALENEVDSATGNLGNELNQRMYGASDGVRFFLSATGAINTTTLFAANPEDMAFVEKNMRLQFINPANGALRAGGTGFVVVDKVDRIAGSATLTGTLNAEVTSVVAGDGVVRWSMNTKDMDGLKGWCPAVVSGADSFLGVNRSVDRTVLAGIYTDQSQKTIRTGLLSALGIAKNQAGKRFESKAPFFINPKNLTQIRQTVEAARVIEATTPSEYGIGIETIEVMGYRFIEDSHAPVDEAVLIGKGAFTRGSCGDQPYIDDQDGNKFHFTPETGKLAFTLAHDGNSYSRRTWNIMRVKLPTVAA
jgi:hypothetical protein